LGFKVFYLFTESGIYFEAVRLELTSLILISLIMKKQPVTHKKNKVIDSKPLPIKTTEEDADDLAHSQKEVLPTKAGEEDADDIMHRPYRPQPGSIDETSMEDPDDLVHRYQKEDNE
jgi:hypothetical protein